MYPLFFHPIFKDRIWGGTKLKTFLNKDIPTNITGESWELSTVPGDVSIVKNGIFKDKNLNELIEQYPEEILGKKIYQQFGKQFPLLFKFIDAREDLSIQLHPNDALAQKRHNSFGKTEMWYVLQADEGARLVVGFKKKSSEEEFLKHLSDKTLPTILNEIPVKKGDVFFLETGTIHAIGGGIMLAEIQQTSDVTYRVYDWDRVDAQGNSRELHLDLSLDAMNYNETPCKKDYATQPNTSNMMAMCPYFTTNFINLTDSYTIENKEDSFRVFQTLSGSCKIRVNDIEFEAKQGDTFLIPAQILHFELQGIAELLEIFV